MKYHYQLSQHRRRKHFRSFVFFSIAIMVLALLIVAAIRLDTVLQDRVNTAKSTTTQQTSAYFASSDQVFNTGYFQFQAPKNWAEIPDESSSGKFVYKGLNKPIVNDQLTVYVNDIPGDLTATRLLPVSLSGDGQKLLPRSVSEHCNQALGDHNFDEKIVKFENVTMNCDVDNTQFNVLVGQTGGTTRLKLKRPDGSSAEYTILYQSFKADPDVSGLLQIMQSFQTR